MSEDQKARAYDLLQGISSMGFDKRNIMSLQTIWVMTRSCTVTLGMPGTPEPWGWRWKTSPRQFTVVITVAMMPFFLGSGTTTEAGLRLY
jgi:hypothetical protein